jgi:hypothetical protein
VTPAEADIDGDRRMDAVFANLGDRPIRSQWCSGNPVAPGGFVCVNLTDTDRTASISYDVAIGDLDQDGRLDAVFAGNRARICLDTGTADRFSCSTNAVGLPPPQVDLDLRAVALGDINGDGIPDAVFAGDSSPGFFAGPGPTPHFSGHPVCLGNGSGGFTCEFATDSVRAMDVALGDLDNDGDLDAVFAIDGPNARVCLNSSNGRSWTCGNLNAAAKEQFGVALGDLDNDGALDAVFAIFDPINPFRNRVCWGNGNGIFVSCSDVSSVADRNHRVALGDVNGDGNLDATFASQSATRVCLGDGKRAFRCNTIAGGGADVALGDVDDDGDLDAVMASRFADNQTCRNDGEGSFQCTAIPKPAFYESLGVALTPVRYRFVAMADSRNPARYHPTDTDDPALGYNGAYDADDVDVLGQLLAHVKPVNPDLILFGGDMVYGLRKKDTVKKQLNGTTDGQDAGRHAGWIDAVNAVMGPDYVKERLYPAFGGHEENTDTEPFKWQAFSEVFNPLGTGTVHRAGAPFSAAGVSDYPAECPQDADYGNTVYYFDFGNARFFVLNNDWDLYPMPADPILEKPAHRVGRCQRAWVKHWLTTNRQSLNFFVHHETVFPVGSSHAVPDDKIASRDAYVTLLGEQRVTMMFSGHEHNYTRRSISKELIPTSTFTGRFTEVKVGLAGADHNNESVIDPRQLETERPILRDHFAVVDVEGDATSVVVFGFDRNASGQPLQCLDYFSSNGLYPGFPSRNGNSVPDICEELEGAAVPGVSAPDDIDGDGTPNGQDKDTAAVSSATGDPLAIDLPEDVSLGQVRALSSNSSTLDQVGKPGLEFPFGMVAYDIRELNPVSTVIVTLFFSAPVPTDATYFVADKDRGWYTIPIESHDGDNKIVLVLSDGGDGDTDGQVNHAITHVGGIGIAGPALLNPPQITFEATEIVGFSPNTTGCLNHEETGDLFEGTFRFRAQFTNKGSATLFNTHAVVRELSNANRVLNTDAGPAGVGATMTIPLDPIAPQASVVVPFTVCLRKPVSFRFLVDVKGFSQ